MISNDELIQYGRKGMKWYQNIYTKDKQKQSRSDGSRNNDNRSDRSRQERSNRNARIDYYARKTGTAKQQTELLKKFSTRDLEDIVKRARLENEYVKLTSHKSTGEKALEIFKKWAMEMVTTSSKEILKAQLKKKLGSGNSRP